MNINLPDNWQQYFDEVIADENQPDTAVDIVKIACRQYYNGWKLQQLQKTKQEAIDQIESDYNNNLQDNLL